MVDYFENKKSASMKKNPQNLNANLNKLKTLGLSDDEINKLIKENGIQLNTNTGSMSSSLKGFDKQIAAAEGWTKPATASTSGSNGSSGASESGSSNFVKDIGQKVH